MNSTFQEDQVSASNDQRVLNEFASKILNEEKLSRIMDKRHLKDRLSYHTEILFRCECDDKSCTKLIAVSTEEYIRVHNRSKKFIVSPTHVRLELEKIKEQFSNYTLVEKFFPT